MPWLFFLAAVRQHARLEAVDLLRSIEGPLTAVAGLFGEHSGEQQLRLRVLERIANPGGAAPLTTPAPPPARSGLVGLDGRPL